MLILTPISLREANAFVGRHHRHHRPSRGHKFSLAAAIAEEIVGVAIVGRPLSRHLDDGRTLEVARLCTPDPAHPNVCSFLYGASARAAFALGYDRVITYIRADETGVSLKAAGWMMTRVTKSELWDRPGRARAASTEQVHRRRYERRAR